ncbi:hypothetical protein [Wenyingzhuangia sp. IMCC45467]
MKKLLLIFLCITYSFNSYAHKDTEIKIGENGKLTGLPKQYSPAQFESNSYTLSIGKNSIKIPECVKKYFAKYEKPTYRFTASWYHNSGILPPYISLLISDYGKPNKCKILFNLDTLEIIKLTTIIRSVNDKGSVKEKMINQKLTSECENEILKSILIK